MEKWFDVEGMMCTGCSGGVEKAVSSLAGVSSVNVDLLGKCMLVNWDESILSAAEIEQAVVSIGFGCALRKEENKPEEKKERKKFSPLFISIPLSAVLMILSMANGPGVLQLALCLSVLAVNRRFFISGLKALVKGFPGMDTLVCLGSGVSFLYALFTLIAQTGGHLYFETAAMIPTFVSIGKALEERAKRRTQDAINGLLDLSPKCATVRKDGAEVVVAIGELKVGDLILIRPGESFSVDATVVEGTSTVNESMVTGESIPRDVKPGDRVISASSNLNGTLWVKAETTGSDTTLSRIIESVRRSGAHKAEISRIADKVARIFVPVVTGLSLLTLLIWLILGYGFEFALNMAVSVLVISCPCALGLATPVAVTVAIGCLAKKGILVKNAHVIENACRIDTVVLDKTGTVTQGKPALMRLQGDLSYLALFAAIEKNSEHILAQCILDYADEHTVEYSSIRVSSFTAIPGKGVSAVVGGQTYYAGSSAFLNEVVSLSPDFALDGCTLMHLFTDKELILSAFVSDSVKSSSAGAVRRMQEDGLKVILLTGDNEGSAKKVAVELGIDEYYAGVLPDKKAEAVEKIKASGRFTAMVGDGVNDSPALVAADVGFAIGNGTDIAIDSADVVLLNGDLNNVALTISYSRRALKTIKQNLFWAFFYNCIGIPVAAGALFPAFGIALTPMLGSICMCLSSVFVTLNALRLSK